MPKYDDILGISIVADIKIIFKSGLSFFYKFFTIDSNTSVDIVLSWISSSIITEYFVSKGSTIASRRSIPSVKNSILVWEETFLSNHTLYPTKSPTYVCSSNATHWATVIAATHLG